MGALGAWLSILRDVKNGDESSVLLARPFDMVGKSWGLVGLLSAGLVMGTGCRDPEPTVQPGVTTTPAVGAKPAPPCGGDTDCPEGTFCGRTDSGAECVAMAREGDECAADGLSRCEPDLTCLAPDPTRKGRGKCVGTVELTAVRAAHERYEGRLLGFEDARVYSADGRCTAMGCLVPIDPTKRTIQRQCCNACSSLMRLKDGSGESMRLKDAKGERYRCAGSECGWNRCTVKPDRRYRVLARVRRGEHDTFLHVESIYAVE